MASHFGTQGQRRLGIRRLLFNLLVLLHTIPMPSFGEPLDSKVSKFMRQLHANVAYSIIVSLLTLFPPSRRR
jgi:hypothetical protein